MNKLQLLIQEIESHLDSITISNLKVSNVPIAWQLHHSLSVIIQVSKILLKTDPRKYKKDFNMLRNVVFAFRMIPRGRGKSPSIVNKKDSIKKEEIIELLDLARELISQHETLPKKSFYKHHVFGTLNKKQTLTFLEIHTEHHLKIVREILNR